MSGYPKGALLLASCRAGLGKIVIVEGESLDQDPYFYGRWFGAPAQQLTFIPQNGCEQVVKAVAELRAQLGPARKIYGIRDRDFCDPADLVAQDLAFPHDGVLRPRRYTLENYLLDPEGWYEVVKLVHRSTHPPGWDSVAAVQDRVLDAYQACLSVAAFNFTVRQEYVRLPGDPTGAEFGYRPHPNAVTASALDQLGDWGAARGATGLRDVYESELVRLRGASVEEWQQRVTGKAVLKVFKGSFPGTNLGHILDNLYLDKYPRPPEDLERLVRQILSEP